MRIFILIPFLFFFLFSRSQALGGNAVFNFLRLPGSPLVTGMGGMNITNTANDVSMAFENPALLQKDMHAQLSTGFQAGFSGLNTYFAAGAINKEKLKTRFAAGLHYIDYGKLAQTDAAGNEMGFFRPHDWVLQLTASRSYLNRWNYGLTLKFIQSSYGIYRANGIAADIGVQYLDTSRGWSIAIVAKNMGASLKTYTGSGGDDLPFDLQMGFTKRLKNAPFAFSFTAHHVHRLALGYNDIAFDNQVGWNTPSDNKLSFDNIFRHVVLASHIYAGPYITADIGFNYLRRKELQVGREGNGLTGFSMGISLQARKFQLRYARTQYQKTAGMNQFGLTLAMDKLSGLGN